MRHFGSAPHLALASPKPSPGIAQAAPWGIDVRPFKPQRGHYQQRLKIDLNVPPGTPLSQGVTNLVFDIPPGVATAPFLFLSGFFHFLIASPWGFTRYIDELSKGRNRFRWVEYSLSSTLMIVLISLVLGISDIAALIGLGIANVSMILFGWLIEMSNTGLMHGKDGHPVRGQHA